MVEDFEKKYRVLLSPKFFVFSPLEIYATLYGIKPVTRKGVTENDLKSENFLLFKKFCSQIGLHIHVISILNVNTLRVGNTNSNFLIYISRNKELIEEMIAYEKKADHDRIGELLGYPKCCRTYYEEIIVNNIHSLRSKLEYTIRNTRDLRSLSFLVNNIFSFETRFWSEIPPDKFKMWNKLSKFMFYYVFHIPCSYECKESLSIAKKVREIGLKEIPEWVKVLDHILSKPVIFFDDFNWGILEGKIENNTLDYSRFVLRFFSDKEIEETLLKGNKIEFEDDNVKVFRTINNHEELLKSFKGYVLGFGDKDGVLD